MIAFCIKKAFFDLWDNLLVIALLNLGFIAIFALILSATNLLAAIDTFLVAFLTPTLAIMGATLYLGGVSLATRDMANYETPEFREILRYFKQALPVSAVLGLIYVVQFFVTSVAFPFYVQIDNIFGLGAIVFLFWASIIWLLASQFYLPIYTRLDRSPKKILRKCFLVFFDNTGFAVVMAIGVALLSVVSLPLAMLIPGPAGVMMWLQSGFKLRLLKYDYLEANPQADRRSIPWDQLLFEDRDKVGTRTLRGMIFPWKE